ncbi:cupin domain-containing protein [Variovorax sp. J2P1-59]|uniref:cupin domain-containing protein n=1 Tax=Variovorax flavidus TaxID=3053501 RepID=UPI002575DD12|nr:cupin domain-containing protein [Variovorax sp. J2P1-59]MDM0074813.1 cupin domain-containing protein [Variovorax sp. J2P1-59]
MTAAIDDAEIPLASSKVQYQTLLKEDGCWVSKTTVFPGGETQWHHHSNVSDRLMVVRGLLTVEVKRGEKVYKLEANEYYAIPAGVLHHVKNETSDLVEYIMVQSGGERDIVLEGTSSSA